MRFEGGRARRRAPGLTPLIDVVFLLLIFFMLATRFGSESVLPLRLVLETERQASQQAGAAAGSSSAQAKRDPIAIRLDSEGATWLAGRRIDHGLLASALAESLRARPARRVVVSPESAVSVQRIVDALQSARQAGARVVALAEAN